LSSRYQGESKGREGGCRLSFADQVFQGSYTTSFWKDRPCYGGILPWGTNPVLTTKHGGARKERKGRHPDTTGESLVESSILKGKWLHCFSADI
jgi:hypothetical protein